MVTNSREDWLPISSVTDFDDAKIFESANCEWRS
jgi:hypothetical protein